MADLQPVDTVLWMARGTWVAMTLRAACGLGVFDQLDQPRTAPDLAAALGSDPHATARLLVALTDLGLLERDGHGDGAYANSATGATLREDHPSGVRNLVLMQSWLPNVASWTRLEDAVRTGSSVFEAVNGMPSWEHLSRHPEAEALFNRAMARRAAGQIEAILAGVDLTGVRTVVDVGGGRGAMLAGILEAGPDLSGVVADRPEVAAEAEVAFAEAGLGARAHGVAADFFDSVPAGADLYVISNVLHDWDDAECVAILATVRAAMSEGARLVVVEKLLDAPRSFEDTRDLHFVDLHMLVMFGARERTKPEYDALLVAAGFPPGSVPDAETSWNVIETTR
ncbi:methyltransferase [Nocardioides cynanchi]|uniref:methyltransferase n=1 Tax=Nocardioides cynanchi TaxID=2558918 RepID=UPI001248C4EA|nr:methyltransferase [Nocardioides cynanchi]